MNDRKERNLVSRKHNGREENQQKCCNLFRHIILKSEAAGCRPPLAVSFIN
jgi:hypothetical protein